jgi:hypothetical protein
MARNPHTGLRHLIGVSVSILCNPNIAVNLAK